MSTPIPRDQWEVVAQLACDMTNASGRGDSTAGRRHYRRLKAYVLEQTRQRRIHPLVLETLADYTRDNRVAVGLYRKALRLARRRGIEGHTILLELAKRHFEIKGGLGLARRYLRAALAEARRKRDRDAVKEAIRVATEHMGGAA